MEYNNEIKGQICSVGDEWVFIDGEDEAYSEIEECAGGSLQDEYNDLIESVCIFIEESIDVYDAHTLKIALLMIGKLLYQYGMDYDLLYKDTEEYARKVAYGFYD